MRLEGGRWDEHRVQQVIGNLLRWGVVGAAVVVLAGAVVYLARHGMEAPSYGSFRGEPANLKAIGGIVVDAIGGSGRGLIQLGLLLLIAVPVARVAFSVVAFAKAKDHTYVVVSLVVLGVLLVSLLGRVG